MKTKYTMSLISFIILVSVFVFSACSNSNNNAESQAETEGTTYTLKVKGGPDDFCAYISETYQWEDLDSNEKINVIDQCIFSCNTMDPSGEYTLKGYINGQEDIIFEWNSLESEIYYEYVQGKRTPLLN